MTAAAPTLNHLLHDLIPISAQLGGAEPAMTFTGRHAVRRP